MDWHQVAQLWAFLSNVATAIGLPLILLSTIYAALTFRAQKRLSEAAYASKLVEISMPFNQAIAENAELAALWNKGGRAYASLNPEEKMRYRCLLSNCMLVYENVVFNHSRSYIKGHSYKTWQRDMEQFFSEQDRATLWPLIDGRYSPDLCAIAQKHLGHNLTATTAAAGKSQS